MKAESGFHAPDVVIYLSFAAFILILDSKTNANDRYMRQLNVKKVAHPKISRRLQAKINELNRLIKLTDRLDDIPYSYFSSTFPQWIMIKEISINRKCICIHVLKAADNYEGGKFNISDPAQLECLMFDLKHIKYALSKVLNLNK